MDNEQATGTGIPWWRVATAVVLLLRPMDLAGASLTYLDGGFLPADWSTTKIHDTNGGCSIVTTQHSSGGNPSFYWNGVHTLAGFNTTVYFAHFPTLPSAQWDPLILGALLSVSMQIDATCLGTAPAFSNPAVQFYLMIRQDGTCYRASGTGARTVYMNESWQTVAQADMTAAGFVRFGAAGPAQPDFSAAGAPIEFGFATGNNGSNRTVTWGVDNFSFSAVPEPCPALLVLLALVVPGWRRRR